MKMSQDTLRARISYSNDLSETEIDNMVLLLGHKCKAETKAKLYRRLRLVSLMPCYGIYDRVMIHDNGNVSYCAGQSYPDEIRTVRKLILEG